MRNVLSTTMNQPNSERPSNTVNSAGDVICQRMVGIGAHWQKRRMRARVASSTYVLRSIETGTNCVHQRLNDFLAMTLCCTANSDNSKMLTIRASVVGATAPMS